jgi:chemotaxis protein histidine kinase CheA
MADFVPLPRKLADKTGKGTPGVGSQAIKKADEAIKEHQSRVDYTKIAGESASRITAEFRELKDDPDSEEVLGRIYELAHNLKGEGASFGYPSVSRVADSICRILEGPKLRRERFIQIVQLEIDSLRAMIRHNVKGPPQGIAQELLDALEFLVETQLEHAKTKAAAR